MAVPPDQGLNSAMNADDPVPDASARHPIERSRASQKPGALHGEVWLTLQTYQAQQLIHGREAAPGKPAIIGLIGFADRLRDIWQAARRDDPYADWWLLKVHAAITAARGIIRDRRAAMDRQLAQMPALEVSIAASRRPHRVQLQFAIPYAYQGAQLLAEYDRVVCMALTARHIGMLDGATCKHIQQACARKLRALFLIPQGYRLLKIDRNAVRLNTGRSSEARQLMGAVPQDILSGERQVPFTPLKVSLLRDG